MATTTNTKQLKCENETVKPVKSGITPYTPNDDNLDRIATAVHDPPLL